MADHLAARKCPDLHDATGGKTVHTQANITITSTALANKVQRALTPEDVRNIITQAQAEMPGLHWRNLGDRDNNAGTVQIASSPALAIIERLTNGMDGLIELAAAQHPTDSPASPREAARKWFGVPIGGIAELTDAQRRRLAAGLQVVLEESGDRDRPTVVVTDQGIGQYPLDAPDTLLSLNRSNKLGSPHLHGAYGQGAAATYRFADYTVIITRRAPAFNGGRQDIVGWTVVWEDPGDPNVDKLPVYRYLVGADNQIPVFEPSALINDSQWHGVRVTHVAYGLRGYTAAYNQPRGGIWALFHSALFDPVLPFLIGGNRDVDGRAAGKGTTRVVIGNAARLSNPGGLRGDLEIAYRNSVTFDVSKVTGQNHGSVKIAYWVVRKVGDAIKGDPTASFATPETAVSMTLSGQRQDAESRMWLKSEIQMPFLSKLVIAQIDVDGLSPLAKRELFSSTRERAVDGNLRSVIYKEVSATLRDDDELRRLEREERNKLLAESVEKVDERVRERLRQYIDTLLKNKTRKVRTTREVVVPPRPQTGGGGPGHRDTDDSGLPADPTFIKFTKDPIRVTQGTNTTVWVEINAKNGYLPLYQDNLVVTIEPSAGSTITDVAKSELLGGKSLWKIHAEVTAPVGDHEIEAVLVTPAGVITATSTITVLPAPTKKKTVVKEEPDKGPRVEWVREAGWDQLDWTERTVGEVQVSPDETLILVNRDQRLLRQAIDSNKKLSEAAIKRREQRYLLPVACGLFEQHHAAQGMDAPPSEDYVAGEHERVAGAVILAISEDLLEGLGE